MFQISEYVQRHVFVSGVDDAHGNPVEGWADPVSVGIYAFNPGTTSEPFIPGHDRVVTQPAVYAPVGTVFGPRDRVTVRGVLYEVDGVPLEYRNPFGGLVDGIQVNLRGVTG